MTTQWEMIAQGGFQFFGKMSASISHEIKNALAIINENAGLLEDLTLLAEQGRPIDPERLKKLARSVMKQIERTDGLVKRLNRFAHSADEPIKTIDLGETLELVVAVVQRLAGLKEARLELIAPRRPIPLATSPFLLENLIGGCLEFLLGLGVKAIQLVPEGTAEGARIRLVGQSAFSTAPPAAFPTEKEKAFLEALKAELQLEPATGEVVLSLPKQI
ncbi:MAG: histidine kinase [Deltaproteobacteria bacterium]|nr:histidine kinase [Deltaproteobacteria bacterium]